MASFGSGPDYHDSLVDHVLLFWLPMQSLILQEINKAAPEFVRANVRNNLQTV